MLRAIRDLQHYNIHAVDGDMGRVHEFYFDDQYWRVRHLVVTTGGWFPRHRVLIPIACVVGVDEGCGELRITLTRDELATSPGIDTERPVSRQHEGEIYWHYGFTGVPLPIGLERGGDPHLRRTREVLGYVVHREHERVGDVNDFLVDAVSWSICYMVMVLAGRCFEKKVLVLPRSIRGVRWEERAVHVDLSWAVLRNAPRYDPRRPIDSDFEAHVRDYYTHAQALPPGPDLGAGLETGPSTRRAAA